ncbi:hypothetical protein ACN28S_27350 [Cystobacter fuscus]
MEPPFRRAMNFLVHLAGNVPTAIIVVCCLSDFWVSARGGSCAPCSIASSTIPSPCSSITW